MVLGDFGVFVASLSWQVLSTLVVVFALGVAAFLILENRSPWLAGTATRSAASES